jgi:hypothetical protein
LSHSTSPFYVRCFSRQGLENYLSGLALNRHPPALCPLSSWDYRHECPFYIHNLNWAPCLVCECALSNGNMFTDVLFASYFFCLVIYLCSCLLVFVVLVMQPKVSHMLGWFKASPGKYLELHPSSHLLFSLSPSFLDRTGV